MNPLQPANGGGDDAFVAKIAKPTAAVKLVPPISVLANRRLVSLALRKFQL
jgi:hypothetical protein